MDAIGARLWNPPRVLRWNTDKRYLARIAHPSLAPPPTAILERGIAVNLQALLEATRLGRSGAEAGDLGRRILDGAHVA